MDEKLEENIEISHQDIYDENINTNNKGQTNEKLEENIEKLHKYIYDQNTDAYNKLQSIYEHLAKRFIHENKKIFNINIDKKHTKELLETICKKYSYNRQDELIQSFDKINVYGNIGIKHYDESDFDDTQETNKAIFDINIIRNALTEFKKLYKFLYPNTEDYYRIDSLLLQCNTPNRYTIKQDEQEKKQQEDLIQKLELENQEFNKQIIKYETQLNLYSNEIKKLRQEKQANNKFNKLEEFNEKQLKEYEKQLNFYKSEIKKLQINNNIQQKKLQKELKQGKNIVQENFVINVGTSPTDYGFRVENITIANKCMHVSASIYATIYNFLQRTNIIEKDIFIEEYEKKQ